MIKKILVTFFALSTISTSAFAGNPLVQLKDFSIEQQDSTTVLVHYADAVVKIEKVDAQRFKVNGQVVTVSKNQTMAELEKQLQTAYKKSGKKSAALEDLFISKAHAITPLFAAVAGGLFGFAMGDAFCKNKQPTAQAPAPEYIAPTVAQ